MWIRQSTVSEQPWYMHVRLTCRLPYFIQEIHVKYKYLSKEIHLCKAHWTSAITKNLRSVKRLGAIRLEPHNEERLAMNPPGYERR